MPKHPRVSVAELLAAKNPWADWFDQEAIGPLSPWRFAALLLRDVPVAPVINRLGAALMKVDIDAPHLIESYLDEFPLPDGVVFGFEHWLEIWDKQDGLGYVGAAENVLESLGDTRDAALVASAVSEGALGSTSQLWFVLGAAQRWFALGGDQREIDPGARWLLELFSVVDGDLDDPLELLLGHLYQRFRDGSARATQPLPERMGRRDWPDDLPYDGTKPGKDTEADLLLWAAHQTEVTDGAPSLTSILELDPQSWPRKASHISALRKQGLMNGAGFVPTAIGLTTAQAHGDAENAASEPWAGLKH